MKKILSAALSLLFVFAIAVASQKRKQLDYLQQLKRDKTEETDF